MNPLVQQANQKSDEIEENIQKFFKQVNDVMSWVPAPLEYLIDPIVKSMELFAQGMREFWERVNQLWEQPGNSDSSYSAMT